MRMIASFKEEVREISSYELINVGNTPITVGNIGASLFTLIIGLKISSIVSKKIVHRLIPHLTHETRSVATYQNLFYYITLGFFLALAFHFTNIPMTSFAMIGSALAIGLGFGTQTIVSNFISGLIIMVEKPVKIGDFIEVEEVSGIVKDIGSRSTKILTPGNKYFILPNSMLLEKKVLNWTLNNPKIRSGMKITVATDVDQELIKKILIETALSHPEIIKDPPPRVLLEDFSARGLLFAVYFTVEQNGLSDSAIISSDLRFVVLKKCREANIEIAVNLNALV